MLVKHAHDVELAIVLTDAELDVSQVLFGELALLPETGPDQADKNDEVLQHLDVQLCAPVQVVQSVTVDDNEEGVHKEHLDVEEASLEVTI